MNLKKYKKIKPKDGKRNHKVSSVNITREQETFLKNNQLNLSLLVRDFLDSLIEKEGK